SEVEVTLIGKSERAPDLVIMGSHDIALDVVVGALAERGVRARTIAVGSLGGVSAATRGECDIAPVHLVDAASGVYNKHLLTPGLALVPGWQRMQGFVFRPDDARFAGRSAEAALQAAMADPAVLMVNRNAGSGTRVLIDSLLRGAKPPGYANQPRSHNAVVSRPLSSGYGTKRPATASARSAWNRDPEEAYRRSLIIRLMANDYSILTLMIRVNGRMFHETERTQSAQR